MAKYTNIRERREVDRFGNVLIYVGEDLTRVEPRAVFEPLAVGSTTVFTAGSGPSAEQTGRRLLDDEVIRILALPSSKEPSPLNRHERRRAKALAGKRQLR